MLTLYICEKPSQARDIASVLGIKSKGDGYIECQNNTVVSFAIGHLMGLVQPHEYDPAWAKWSWPGLPMIPSEFKYKPNPKTIPQYKILCSYIKKASSIVIATDAGREGEYIAREVMTACNYKGPIKRLWASTMVASDIKKAIENLRDGKETEALYHAAMARSKSDWLIGMNGSRAVTLGMGNKGTFPVGRVQTPTLAMVVRRDLSIDNFKPETYYELKAFVQTPRGDTFEMTHAPSEEKRIKSKEEADKLMRQACNFDGPCEVVKKDGKESPPLPFSLPTLQKEANKVMGLSAANTLSLAQKLYEAKAISYPRSDCSHLGSSQKGQIRETLAVIHRVQPDAVSKLAAMGVVVRPSTFNDAKLTDHHGIIPTTQAVELSGKELELFNLIAKRYLITLAPDMEYQQTKVTVDANGVPFSASGRVIRTEGWYSLK